MNDKKICFISCIDDKKSYHESLYYINKLEIPNGYEIECIAVENSESIFKGFNKAMNSSDAKYKVYFRQNTYIKNEKFIESFLNVFNKDNNIGMLGTTGANIVNTTAIIMQSEEKVGMINSNINGSMEFINFGTTSELYEVVQAIDGSIMVTQYDIPWREDVFSGWNYYDVSQSIEFQKKGYCVAVLNQEESSIVNDYQRINSSVNNELDNEIFTREYMSNIIDLIIKYIKQGLLNNKNIVNSDINAWRNLYISKIDYDEKIELLDQCINELFKSDFEDTDKIFSFDAIKALDIVSLNRKNFLYYLEKAKLDLSCKEYEKASQWCYKAAKYASDNHPGFYNSPELESILIECANKLPEIDETVDIKKEKNKKRRVLHVMSEGYATGGHTRLVKNWINRDKESIHSLITTWQSDSLPNWLVEEVKKSNGWVESLQNLENFMSRASRLRQIAYEWADVVVLHVHMFDVIPVIAFGVAGGPPILFMNHGDHVFWIGSSIIDNLVNFRDAGKDLAFRRRGVTVNSILPLPLSLPNRGHKYRDKVRKQLGIKKDTVVLLTIATPYKFKSFGRVHYIDILEKILSENDNTIAIVVGPDNTKEWLNANKNTKGRIIPLGMQSNIEKYYLSADIYIDSYMIGSVTSALDGGIYGLPIASLQNYNNRTLSFNDTSYNSKNNFVNMQHFLEYVNKLIKDKNYRSDESKKICTIIKNDHFTNWKSNLDSIYEMIENWHHKMNALDYIENKVEKEDLFLALFQNSIKSANEVDYSKEDSKNTNMDMYTILKSAIFKYYNENKLVLSEMFGEYVLEFNQEDYHALNAMAAIYHDQGKKWLSSLYMEEAVKFCPKDSSIMFNYIGTSNIDEIKHFIYENYKYNRNNEAYSLYYKHLKNFEKFDELFSNKKYKEAVDLYNDFSEIKAKLYRIKTVKDICDLKGYKYTIIQEKKLENVHSARFFAIDNSSSDSQFLTHDIYIAELENVSIIGENSTIISDEICLYDIAKRDSEKRYDLRFGSLLQIDEDNCILRSIDSNIEIDVAISLVGFAPSNYYHLTMELLSRLQYTEAFEEYRNMPLLIDESVFNTSQYVDLLNTINKFNHPIIKIKNNFKYNIKKLIYPSYNTWMPINIKEGYGTKEIDSLIDPSAVSYIRKTVLENRNIIGSRKIFISRKNANNSRLTNEDDVIKIFKQYGFEVVYPENLTFKEQVEIFSNAEYIAGTTGAAFTNILYCPSNAKIICIIPKKYNFHIYSSIGNTLGLQCIFLDAEVISSKKYSSFEYFKVNLNHCNELLNSFGLNNKLSSSQLIEHLHRNVNELNDNFSNELSKIKVFNDLIDTINATKTRNLNEKDLNKYFETERCLELVLKAVEECADIKDIKKLEMIFSIMVEKLRKV